MEEKSSLPPSSSAATAVAALVTVSQIIEIKDRFYFLVRFNQEPNLLIYIISHYFLLPHPNYILTICFCPSNWDTRIHYIHHNFFHMLSLYTCWKFLRRTYLVFYVRLLSRQSLLHLSCVESNPSWFFCSLLISASSNLSIRLFLAAQHWVSLKRLAG